MITLRQLRYFEALAATSHFGRAAERCAVTQPALSMQVRDLEREIGVTLIDRGGGGAALTDEGREVARRAGAILTAVADLADSARRRRGVLAGALRLGIIPSVAPYLLPRALPAIQARFPALDLEVRETQTAPLVEDLAAGRLDAIVAALPLAHPQIEEAALFDDPFRLAVPMAEAPDWMAGDWRARLPTARMLLLEEGHCLRDQALQVCNLPGDTVRRALGATSLATIVQMVAAGYGVTLLPDLCAAIEVRDARIALVSFEEDGPRRTVGLAWRRASPRREDFLALAETIRGARTPQQPGASAR